MFLPGMNLAAGRMHRVEIRCIPATTGLSVLAESPLPSPAASKFDDHFKGLAFIKQPVSFGNVSQRNAMGNDLFRMKDIVRD